RRPALPFVLAPPCLVLWPLPPALLLRSTTSLQPRATLALTTSSPLSDRVRAHCSWSSIRSRRLAGSFLPPPPPPRGELLARSNGVDSSRPSSSLLTTPPAPSSSLSSSRMAGRASE